MALRRACLALLLAALVARPTVIEAQAAHDSIRHAIEGVREGRRLRLATGDSVIVGRHRGVSGAPGTAPSLRLETASDQHATVSLAAIDSLWVMDDRFRRGAWIGGITGAVLGGVGWWLLVGLGGAEAGSAAPSAAVGLAGAAIGLLGGAAVGGTMGAASRRFTRLYP